MGTGHIGLERLES